MACLSCHCISKAFVFASVPANNNNDSSSTSSPQNSNTSNPKPSIPITKAKTKTVPPRKKHHQSKLQQQLNLIRIERAIGAGSYRDSDPTGSEEEHRNSVLKGLLPNDAGALEGPVEKKLRETGEWLSDKTERQVRSSGKNILMFFFKWVLPIYIFMFLVTSGIVKLPFTTPLLDDLLM